MTPEPSQPNRTFFENSEWKKLVAILGAIVVVGGGVIAAFSFVFATKAELKQIELVQADGSFNTLAEWRIKTLEVQTANLEARTQRIDKNVARLLERFRIAKAPEPEYQELPPKPKE